MKTIAQLLDLSGRAALITGGAGHIALAAAQALVEQGAQVAILDREVAACQRRLEELSLLKKEAGIPVPCDLENEEETRSSVRRVIKEFGCLDIVVHCAAYSPPRERTKCFGSSGQPDISAFESALHINLTAPFVIMQEGKEALGQSGHGSVIFFSSIYGMVGPDMRLYEGTTMSNSPGYNAAKGGVIQLTRYFATLLAPRIRVNAISPGGVWRNQPEAFHQRYKSRAPLGRMAAEEDLKGAIAYLASDLSAYVTGHNLVVDGGWTAW